MEELQDEINRSKATIAKTDELLAKSPTKKPVAPAATQGAQVDSDLESESEAEDDTKIARVITLYRMEAGLGHDKRKLTQSEHDEIHRICGTPKAPTKYRAQCREEMEKIQDEREAKIAKKQGVAVADIKAQVDSDVESDSEQSKSLKKVKPGNKGKAVADIKAQVDSELPPKKVKPGNKGKVGV